MHNFQSKAPWSMVQDSSKGFSLIELILYISIIGSLVGVVSAMFIGFSWLQTKAESQTELTQNARSAVERIRQEIVKASSVSAPIAGVTDDILELSIGSNLTCFRLLGGILQMAEGAVTCTTWSNITSSKVSITNSDLFKRIDNLNANSTIQISLTFIYNNRSQYTYSMKTTVGLR